MQYKDYYKILGVSPKASEEEIRKVYKKLAVKFHPDNNPDNSKAEERFKEISEAKEILLDKANRRQYDALRAQYQGFYAGAAGAGAGAGSRSNQGIPKDFNSLFGRFMDEIVKRQKKRQIKGHLKISLREAYYGVQQTLRLGDKRVKVKIPPGVSNDQKLRLSMSHAGEEDMFIRIVIPEDKQFVREGDDLFSHTNIDLFTAVLGKKVPIETLKGKMMVSIPAGTQPGEKLKLKGLGMPDFDHPSKKGNLYLTVNVSLPKKLKAEEKALFEALQKMRA